jgi:CelD/BcsL family acetyltransferase involved in cellulose biosynthesis
VTTLSDNEWSEAAIARPDSVEVERVGRLEDLREDWLLLEEAADHPFATWEWNSQWWRHFGGDRELLALVCRGSTTGQPVAIVPLRPDRVGPVRVARFLGDGDLRGPVCRAADRPAVAAAVRAAVQAGDLGRCRLLLAERLPGGQSWGEMLGGRRVATHPDPLLSLGGIDWEEFLGARSRNFRQQVRRRERRLVEEHGLSFRLSSDRGRWGADLDSLFRLHALRWGGRGTGVFAGERGRFHRRRARLAAALARRDRRGSGGGLVRMALRRL